MPETAYVRKSWRIDGGDRHLVLHMQRDGACIRMRSAESRCRARATARSCRASHRSRTVVPDRRVAIHGLGRSHSHVAHVALSAPSGPHPAPAPHPQGPARCLGPPRFRPHAASRRMRFREPHMHGEAGSKTAAPRGRGGAKARMPRTVLRCGRRHANDVPPLSRAHPQRGPARKARTACMELQGEPGTTRPTRSGHHAGRTS